jgi:hypothetical protein
MAKKFTKENMYDWVSSQEDVSKLKALDAKISPLLKEKVALLKKASAEYKSKKNKPKRTPEVDRFKFIVREKAIKTFKRTPKAEKIKSKK